MLKQELIKSISKDSKLKRKKSTKVYDLVFEMIAKDLKKKKSSKIKNFGEFCIVRQKLKIVTGKNGQITITPPKDIIEFNTNYKQNKPGMSKEKIISAASIDFGLSKEKAEKTVNAVFDTVLKALNKEGELSIQKFGSFKKYSGKDNEGKSKIKFTPAKKLALRINSDFKNLKKVKLKKNLIAFEKEFKKYEVNLLRPDNLSDELSENQGWVNSKSGSRKILISDDLINLHKEITKNQ